MIREVDAVFQNGVFVPEQPCPVPEGAAVHLVVETPGCEPPELDDPAAREQVLRQMIERIQNSSVLPQAFPIQREELHERR